MRFASDNDLRFHGAAIEAAQAGVFLNGLNGQ